MSTNGSWQAWKTRLETLFTYKPLRPDELTAAVDAFMLSLRNAVYATALEAARDAIEAHEAKR